MSRTDSAKVSLADLASLGPGALLDELQRVRPDLRPENYLCNGAWDRALILKELEAFHKDKEQQ
eukprot:CAMPEP_0168459084 /NCGR_PEP_ID=MMETSP0228-20121227/52725_1 /TAXON_ID=133427 /ORGANISM="Protoceratium reticulatum, Strain CCCM 535 (=CCMP 1889)" /LENGTH=63 /DNA_ID=CAMNT_0008474233 /DNA_START=82 /DNA_END=270 /DNA_ORIENTATION=-